MTTEVAVCVCTYRRASIAQTLQSLSGQNLPQGVRMRVIVVDNDETASAQIRIEQTAHSLGLACLYVHAPSRNIALARNAALDTATEPLIAFIDDDEVATPDWLHHLLQERSRSNVAIVLGPVQAIYTAGPAWLAKADLHSVRPVCRGNGKIDTGYTCNVLLDRAAMTDPMQAVRFDLALGRSGGEDTVFFGRLHALGCRIACAENAVVLESVSPARASMRWLLPRAFRSGQSHARLLLATEASRISMLATALMKCACCAAACLFFITSATRSRKNGVRAALHAGVVAKLSGMSELELY